MSGQNGSHCSNGQYGSTRQCGLEQLDFEHEMVNTRKNRKLK